MTGAPLGDLDLDDLPTGTAVRVLLRLVGAQQTQVGAMQGEIAEIKALVKSAIMFGKLLAGLVPIIAAATTALIWAIRNIR